jgi:diadenosine tetraphosphatase ApaH/serine/threonine PP2A family protein phosphatase
MRYAIFSDVHGNLDALQAVLQDLDLVMRQSGRRIDQYWCLGDVVGYGPQPAECLRLVRARCTVCIPGNHDWAAVGKLDFEDFSGTAAESAAWTRAKLGKADLQYLEWLPPTVPIGEFTLAHGSPSNPIWEYLTSEDTAAPNFAYFDSRYCVVGHTHLPTVFAQPVTGGLPHRRVTPRFGDRKVKVALAMATPGGPSRSSLEAGEFAFTSSQGLVTAPCWRWSPTPGLFRVPPNYRAIINPGSVGQPRDGDPRASYVIYDSDLGGFEFRRVAYNVAEVQRKIQMYGLPREVAELLAARLATGT